MLVMPCGTTSTRLESSMEGRGTLFRKRKFDGFVKSPSAALRFTFVVAAYLIVRFTPQVLRALHGRGERRSPAQGRPAGRPYNRNQHYLEAGSLPNWAQILATFPDSLSQNLASSS